MVTKPTYGVDWARGQWLVVGLTRTDEITVDVEPDFEALMETSGGSQVVVDVPIGLLEGRDRDGDEPVRRRCDVAARKYIGPRYRSVFPAPSRLAAHRAADDRPYDEVADVNQEVTGKRITQQAYHISKAIAEVDVYILKTGAADTVLEGHPEVCFRAFKGDVLHHPKASAAGVGERLTALESVLIDPAELLHEALTGLEGTDHQVQVDDVLDALALAATAREPGDGFCFLPETEEPPKDVRGIPMQMVYRPLKN